MRPNRLAYCQPGPSWYFSSPLEPTAPTIWPVDRPINGCVSLGANTGGHRDSRALSLATFPRPPAVLTCFRFCPCLAFWLKPADLGTPCVAERIASVQSSSVWLQAIHLILLLALITTTITITNELATGPRRIPRFHPPIMQRARTRKLGGRLRRMTPCSEATGFTPLPSAFASAP